jgi:putative ATPase
MDVYERLGSPEGELAIAQAVLYLATAPKSIGVYRGFNKARAAAKRTGSLMPPAHILNAPTRLMKDPGYGTGTSTTPTPRPGSPAPTTSPEACPGRRSASPPATATDAASPNGSATAQLRNSPTDDGTATSDDD